MPKTGKNVYKRKDGRWEGRYVKGRDGSGRIIYGSVYGTSSAAAKERLVRAAAGWPAYTAQEDMNDTQSPVFADVAHQWLAAASLAVKPSTYAVYSAALALHILPSIGSCAMRRLTTQDICGFATEKLVNGRADGNGGLSPKYVRDMLSIIKSVVGYAHGEGLIAGGPVVTYPKQRQRAARALTLAEQVSLEAVLASGIDIYKLGILLCLYTGIRVGELCALRWRDISPDFGTLHIRQTLQRVGDIGGGGSKTSIHIDTPKSPYSVRGIPIARKLSPHLEAFARDGSAFLLSTDCISRTEPRTMQNHFARCAKAADIAGASFHSTRHTFATRCIEAGVDIKSVSEILGHSSVSITLGLYVHPSFDQKREGMNKLERYVGR